MVLSYRFPIRQKAYEMADLTIFHHASTGFLSLFGLCISKLVTSNVGIVVRLLGLS
jgi:hypothetical protein